MSNTHSEHLTHGESLSHWRRHRSPTDGEAPTQEKPRRSQEKQAPGEARRSPRTEAPHRRSPGEARRSKLQEKPGEAYGQKPQPGRRTEPPSSIPLEKPQQYPYSNRHPCSSLSQAKRVPAFRVPTPSAQQVPQLPLSPTSSFNNYIISYLSLIHI